LNQLHTFLSLVAPIPRPARPSEKKYLTILPDGKTSELRELPCWHDGWRARKEASKTSKDSKDSESIEVEEAEVFMSVVVPAYNEEERLSGMLEEAVDFLQREYGDAHGAEVESEAPSQSAKERKANGKPLSCDGDPRAEHPVQDMRGWEILVVSDGSSDQTVETALKFARDHQLEQYPVSIPGPWSQKQKNKHSTHIPHGSIRVVALEENRGKGGAVTHGMRHVRGQYVIFADADGASKFDDLADLVHAAREVEDPDGRAVAIGSRAHLVGSEAVVKARLPLFLIPQAADHKANQRPALRPPQPPNARLPPLHPHPDAACNFAHKRHAMWLQAVLACLAALHNTVHAHGGLDL
jgi:dolichyl-phosphate beta-glucosyltransferase